MPHATALPSPLRTIHVMGIAGTAMAALAGMLKDAGYTGYISLEFEGKADPLAAIPQSLSLLRKAFA